MLLSPKQILFKGRLLSYRTIALLILGLLLFVARPQFHKLAPSMANEGSPVIARDLVADENSRQLSFEVNRGQAEPHVKFLSRGRGYSVLLTETKMVLAVNLTQRSSALEKVRASENRAEPAAPPKVLEVSLKGAHSTPEVIGLDQQSGKVNYFVRNDVAKWRTGIPTYGKVLYKGVYPGTDLIYYGKGSNLEYDFHLAPGADPGNITLNFKGAETINIDASGDLVLGLTGGEIRERKPDVYQIINGEKKEVAGRFVFKSKHEVGFEVEAYDEAQPLVIDPVLSFATYLGGGDIDFGLDVAVDNDGNSYVIGQTPSVDFPLVAPYQLAYSGGLADIFVAKVDRNGGLIYSTYIGGSAFDSGPASIAIDAAGSAYVCGSTSSVDFPTLNPLQALRRGIQDGFVTKLDPTGGALVYSTYLGGSGRDSANALAVDPLGNVYISGSSNSADFPLANPIQDTLTGMDAFVAKLDVSGSALIYSTYLGGSASDEGFGVALDSLGNTYVTGRTSSPNFPTASPVQASLAGGDDAFVTKINAGGDTLVFSTFLGGTGNEIANAVTVSPTGSVYVAGGTGSGDFPTVNPFQGSFAGGPPPVFVFDGFVSVLSGSGATLIYSSYLGGSGGDVCYGIAVDSESNIYLAGETGSTDFPTERPLQGTNSGAPNRDAFVSKFNPTGNTLIYSTYLGGTGDDGARSLAIDPTNAVYLMGFTLSNDFPTLRPAQQTLNGTRDAFVAKLLPKAVTTTSIDSSANPSLWLQTVTFTAVVRSQTPAGYIPDGFVVFAVGSASRVEPLDATGTTRAAFQFLTVGPRKVSVQYVGTSYFAPSTAKPLTQIVKKR